MQAHGDRYIKEEEEHNRKEKGNVNDWLLSGKKKNHSQNKETRGLLRKVRGHEETSCKRHGNP